MPDDKGINIISWLSDDGNVIVDEESDGAEKIVVEDVVEDIVADTYNCFETLGNRVVESAIEHEECETTEGKHFEGIDDIWFNVGDEIVLTDNNGFVNKMFESSKWVSFTVSWSCSLISISWLLPSTSSVLKSTSISINSLEPLFKSFTKEYGVIYTNDPLDEQFSVIIK